MNSSASTGVAGYKGRSTLKTVQRRKASIYTKMQSVNIGDRLGSFHHEEEEMLDIIVARAITDVCHATRCGLSQAQVELSVVWSSRGGV